MANKPKLPLVLRAMVPEDVNFITNSWLKSYAESAIGPRQKGVSARERVTTHHGVSPTRFYKKEQDLIHALSQLRKIVVACDPEAPNFIYGYACGEARFDDPEGGWLLLDFVYVKTAYRLQGIARQMLEEGFGWTEQPIFATHWTFMCNEIDKYHRINYDDYEIKIGIMDFDAST